MLTKEKFESYHQKHPEVYTAFSKFTFEAIRSGRRHFGIAAIAERVRWYSAIESTGEDFKINNNYRAFYARLFEQNNPAQAGFFFKRHSVADGS